MNLRDFLEIVSALFGLISGGFFSIGVLKLKTSTIPRIATMSGGAMVAEELAKQKADFAFGAGFLTLAFLFQITTKIFPIVALVTVSVDFQRGVVRAFFIATLFGIISYFLHRKLQQKLVRDVTQGIASLGE